MSTATGRLVLACTDLTFTPVQTALIDYLAGIGLIDLDTDLDLPPHHHLVGDRLLSSVTFMGCSPYLKIAPEQPGDSDYCTVLVPSTEALQFLFNTQPMWQVRIKPACPVCRAKIVLNEIALSEVAEQPDRQVQCQGCGQSMALAQLQWGKYAGFVRCHVGISHIFAGEAVPVDSLLAELAAFSQSPWRYFYA